jgi:CubicO group peptidase (beta-lactamase class C family)
MNSNTQPWLRDPKNPGAPIIPRGEWDFPPYHRWTFQHVREMTPTAEIWRGPGPVLPLPERRRDIDGVTFTARAGRRTIADWLEESATDGFMVLSRGAVVDERYRNGLKPHRQHLAMSVSKSVTSAIFGILVQRGLIDVEASVTTYLPELEATGYRGAKVQHVLDMTSGVLFDESYTTPGSHMQKLGQACGWFEVSDPAWPMTVWQLILQLTEQQRPHGQLFQYRSIETDVLAFLMQRVTGKPLAELISEELWAPMGAEENAYITLDRGGYALADGGFNATLRDFARFALLLLNGGKAHGRQIVPAEWIEVTRNANHAVFGEERQGALPRGAYRNQFWIEDSDSRVFMCFGIFGQYIYMDPEAGFALVKLSTDVDPVSEERTADMLAAAHALKVFCAGT